MKHFYVEMDDLTRIESALGMMKDKSKMILKAAINNAAKQTESRMTDEAKERYRFKGGKSAIRKANSIAKAKAGMLSAVVEAKGASNELLDFHVRPSAYFPGGRGAPLWVSARVLRQGEFHKVALRPDALGDKYKGFVVRYKSGHYALGQRVPGEHMKSNPGKEAVKSLLSLSTPKAEEKVYNEKIEPEMYDMLQRNIQEQIARYLG